MIALCLGGARCVWEDLALARHILGDAATIVVACNFAGISYQGHLDAWATLHPEACAPWLESRAADGLNTDYRLFSHKAANGVRPEIVPQTWYGSSGLYAAQIALEVLGAQAVILCGVPMQEGGEHLVRPGVWPKADIYRPAFLEAKAGGADIRSMSGWSADVLGRPDAEWLAGQGIVPPAEIHDLLHPVRSIDMRVKFIRDRIWTPPEDRRIAVAYRAGMELTIKRAWGAKMIEDDDCVEVPVPARTAEG